MCMARHKKHSQKSSVKRSGGSTWNYAPGETPSERPPPKKKESYLFFIITI